MNNEKSKNMSFSDLALTYYKIQKEKSLQSHVCNRFYDKLRSRMKEG